MIRRRLTGLRIALVVLDIVSVWLLFHVASWIRFGAEAMIYWRGLGTSAQVVATAMAAAVAGTFAAGGLYRVDRRWTLHAEVRRLSHVGVIAIGATLAGLYVFDLTDVSRLFVAAFFALVAASVLTSRLFLHLAFIRVRRRGHGVRHTLVIGTGARAADYISRVSGRPDLGVVIVGCVDDQDRVVDVPRLGTIPELPDLLGTHVVDEVAICLPFTMWPTIQLLSRMCEQQGKSVVIPVDLMARTIERGRLERLDGLPVLAVPNAPDHAVALFAKTTLDRAAAVLMMIVAAPLIAAVSVTILLTEGRPLIFSHRRAGLHGRPFHAHKFRTMVPRAEQIAPQADADPTAAARGVDLKRVNDPRITPVGRFLRKTSLDELPQLWNVIKGDMSLVGPRPPALAELDGYDVWHRRKLSVKPGLTGLWQITARNDSDFDRRVELDLEYIDNWSLWLDLTLMCRTPAALVMRPGS